MSTEPTKILIVDDDPGLVRLLQKWMERRDFVVECAGDGRQAVTAIEANCPHILITDRDMPHMDGIELCRWLRKQDLDNYVYAIVVTSHCSSDAMVEAFEAGADDFLKKPIDKAELVARVQSGRRVLELETKLNVLAKTDSLTGLATRRTFFEHAEREWSRARRHHIPLSAVMIDIDFFKRINDTHGHRIGDQALRAVAKVLQESCRSSDVIGRYGGEEFCVLLPETDEPHAIEWSERVRERLGNRKNIVADLTTAITASFGVAQRLADTESSEALVDLADQALLVAKRSGRDRVVGFQSLSTSTQVQCNADGPQAIFDGLVARNVMTTIIAGLDENETVGRAARYFLRFRFNSAPVVDRDGKLVGILSERDVMSIMMWPKWWATKIKDVMKQNVVCYEETTTVASIYEFLCRVSLRGVIVVKEGRPTGMISRGSLLRWFTNLLAVTPSAVLDVPTVERPPEGDGPVSVNPRANVEMIARALSEEVEQLEFRIGRETNDLVPAVVGGVSRIEELLNDLLAFSRHANTLEQSNTSDGSPSNEATVGTLADLLEISHDDTDDTSHTLPGTRLPAGTNAEILTDPYKYVGEQRVSNQLAEGAS
ncbi:MAG: diguanylate cyclase [Planctomycetes bacterium]|nr:diguanylate cyclase [Planctomycetota bacterium]